jgi:hypothetical protein
LAAVAVDLALLPEEEALVNSKVRICMQSFTAFTRSSETHQRTLDVNNKVRITIPQESMTVSR